MSDLATRPVMKQRRFDRLWRSFLRAQNWELSTGLVIIAIMVLAALLAPYIAPYHPNQINIVDSLQAPSWHHWMGTDFVGRDIFSRVLYGLRVDLLVVAVITYLGLIVGVTIGTISGYVGGWFDAVIGRVADTVIAFPFIVLVLAVVAIVGPGLKGVGIGIILVGWALYFRLSRSEMLVLRELPFIMSTKALGYSHLRAIFRHALPNLIRTSLVYSTVDVVVNMLVIAGLSYLGLGQQAPGADLGSIIASGQSYLLSAWWITTIPGVVLMLFGIGVSLVGDGITRGDLTLGSL
jgi:peptide/nickel transport system permease protein